MSSPVFYFDADQLRAAGEHYVETGPADLRALRQQEVDGALAFLLDERAQKLRPVGLQPKSAPLERPARNVLDAMEASRG